jgi:Glutaminase
MIEALTRRVESVRPTSEPASADQYEVKLEGREQPALLSVTTLAGVVNKRVLDTLFTRRLLTYFEISTENHIVEVDVPTFDFVRATKISSAGDRLLALDSHASVLTLRKDEPDFERLSAVLTEGLEGSTDGSRVALHIRPGTYDISAAESAPADADSVSVATLRSDEELVSELSVCNRGAVDAWVRDQFSTTCRPDDTSTSCIPYTYVANYCWWRAHETCDSLMNDRGISTLKLWAFSQSPKRPIRILTDCMTRWNYHVVVAVRTESQEIRVVDPSLYRDGSVPLAVFLRDLRPHAATKFTNPDTYYFRRLVTPVLATPIARANDRLYAIASLQKTFASEDGAPPYTHCQFRPL